jgi:L-fuculose-phosphate aldolase
MTTSLSIAGSRSAAQSISCLSGSPVMVLASERALLVRYAQRLRSDGLVVGTAGNLSSRAGDLVAITPSGVDYDSLSPDSICVVELDGSPVDARCEPSRELPMHLAAYGALDTGAVVHTHSPSATALGTVVEELPAIHYLIAELGGPVRVAPYATPGSEELAAAMVRALAGRSAALLANHGALTVGETLEQAYSRAVTLEWLAALYLRARQLGSPSDLPADEVERLGELVRSYGADREA